jgi:hypothetical protein
MPLVGEWPRKSGPTKPRAFPKDLAKVVIGRWDNFVSGPDYVRPPRPSDRQLSELLEIAYLSAALQEEGRYPQFNILTVPLVDSAKRRYLGDVWEFDNVRPLSVEEVRRLAPAIDFKKSGILAKWDSARWYISGLADFGTSWNRAKSGFQYHYQSPECLFVQVDRPGRMKVYQTRYLLAALVDGQLERHKGLEIITALGASAHNGLKKMWREISHPKLEQPREYHDFVFTALWNVFAALANSISEGAHGGAIVIVPKVGASFDKQVRVKYRLRSSALRDSFISYMTARNHFIDIVIKIESGDVSLEGECAIAELALSERQSRLVEATRLVARLSGCDGAIVLSDDLYLLGFGAEILSDLNSNIKIRDVRDEIRGVYKPLNIEQFGQRHRSAIKLVSKQLRYVVIAISQDGPISAIWSRERRIVNVKRGANLVNLDMPFA